MKKSERTLAAAPPFQIEPAPLGFDLVPVKPLTGYIHTVITYLIGASFVSLAPTFFMKKSERTLAAAPPFQIEPAPLGFDLVPVKPLTGCIHTATTYLIGASFVSLAPTFFMKKSERTLAAAPPFQIEPAPLGFDLVPVKPLTRCIHTVITYLIGASFVSLAPTFFMKKSERTLAAAPPFQIEPAPLGFDLVPVKPLKHQITETGAPF